jgi:hypothetical protein
MDKIVHEQSECLFCKQPYLLLALSANAQVRKCCLQWSYILALESQQKGKFCPHPCAK